MENRHSLLDVIVSRYNNLKEKKINSRVLYVGSKSFQLQKEENGNSSRLTTLAMFHESLFAKLGFPVGDFPYGLLYECKEGCIHVLEGTNEAVVKFLETLHQKMLSDPHCCLANVKILNYTDDVGNVVFPRWTAKDVTGFVDEDEEEIGESKDKYGSNWIQLIHHSEHKLLNIGKKILSSGPQSMELFLNNATQNVPHLVPSPFLINQLLKCDKCLTLKEWIELFSQPVDICLDNDLIHPMEPSTVELIKETLETTSPLEE